MIKLLITWYRKPLPGTVQSGQPPTTQKDLTVICQSFASHLPVIWQELEKVTASPRLRLQHSFKPTEHPQIDPYFQPILILSPIAPTFPKMENNNDPSISLNIVAGPVAPPKPAPGKRKGFRKNNKKRKLPRTKADHPGADVGNKRHKQAKNTPNDDKEPNLPTQRNTAKERKRPELSITERPTADNAVLVKSPKPETTEDISLLETSSNDSKSDSHVEATTNDRIDQKEVTAVSLTPEETEEQEQQHATYMATFHARPYELDRRAGAVRKLPSTKPSHHLHADTKDMSWESLGITNRTLHRRIPHTVPTHIQCQSVPAILEEHHTGILLQAETGSGKTLAYAAPCLQLCLQPTAASVTAQQQRRRIARPRCLILVPTRELAYQTLACIQPLLAGTPAVPGILVGGVAKDKNASSKHRKSEKAAIRKGWAVVVATASRLLDHLQTTQALTLDDVHTIVLDEADRLALDPAHCKAIQQIWEHLPATVQRTILVSATLPKDEILSALRTEKETRYTVPSSWVTVTAGRKSLKQQDATDGSKALQEPRIDDSESSNPKQLRHAHLVVHAKLRWPALIACLLTSKHKKTVVFCSTCAAVDYLGQLLPQVLPTKTYSVYCLHGNMTLQQRQSSLSQFTSVTSNASSGILLATDVAGRGLNLGDGMNNVTILQYDPPSCCSDYVHRAGRAARAGAPGQCLLFLLPSEVGVLSVLENVKSTALSLSHVLEQAAKIYTSETPTKNGLSSSHQDSSGSKKQRPAEAFATQLQCTTEAIVEAQSLRAAAAAAFCAHVRAYTVKEKALKPFFPPKALHLGHVARSFGWKGAPSELNKALQHTRTTTTTSKRTKEPRKNRQRMAQVAKALEGMGSM